MKDKYDVIIIGSGIAGLVCGCYLAKAGMKSIIIEKMDKPGGYCSSFERNGFLFDVGAHAFGSCRPHGQIGKLMRSLGLESEVKFKRKNISNTIVTPDHQICFSDNVENTIDNLQKAFPRESKKIESFFNFILDDNINLIHFKLKSINFQNMLDSYFADHKLKTVLGVLTGNLGILPQHASAFTSAILYREHIFDGGYYPEGGMQSFPNALTKKFEKFGGKISLSSEVKAVVVKNKRAIGVITEDGSFLKSHYVISNCDAFHTYTKLIDKDSVDPDFISQVAKLKTSQPFFVVHIGLKRAIRNESFKCSTLWHFQTYDLEDIYKTAQKPRFYHNNKYLIFGFPYLENRNDEAKVITLYSLAPYQSAGEWSSKKMDLCQLVTDHAKKILPDIHDNISTVCASTPHDFYRYTYNKSGSISGWASTVSQVNGTLIGKQGHISNLLHTGHWVMSQGGQGGIPMVVFSGRTTAKYLLSLSK